MKCYLFSLADIAACPVNKLFYTEMKRQRDRERLMDKNRQMEIKTKQKRKMKKYNQK